MKLIAFHMGLSSEQPYALVVLQGKAGSLPLAHHTVGFRALDLHKVLKWPRDDTGRF